MKFIKNASLVLSLFLIGSLFIGEIPSINHIAPTTAYAKGFSGGGSRSFSSSSSKSSSSWGSSSKSTSSGSGWGSSKKSAPMTTSRSNIKAQSNVDRSLAAKAKSNGTLFTNKDSAIKSFRSDPKMQQKYSGKFSSEPTSRPSYIPQTYKDQQGNSYNITYNQQYGGYGYMGGGGWVGFDPMSMLTGAMLYSVMTNDHENNYYIQSATDSTYTSAMQPSSNDDDTFYLIIIFIIITVLVVLMFFALIVKE